MSADFLSDLHDEIRAAAHRQASGSARRPRAHVPRIAAIAIAGALVVGGAVQGLRSIPESTPRTGEDAAPSPGTHETNARLIEAFALLRLRPPNPDVPVPESFRTDPHTTSFEPDFSAARRVVVDGGSVAVWVVPADGGLCVLTQAGQSISSGCPTTERALEGREVWVMRGAGVGLRSGQFRIVGLLPDEATNVQIRLRNGRTEAVTVTDNVYGETVSGVPEVLEWTDADGRKRSIELH